RAIAEEVRLVVEQRLDHLLGERGLVRLAESHRKVLERIETRLAQHARQRGADAPQPVGRELLARARLEQAGDDAERVLALVDHAAPNATAMRAAICSGGRTAEASPAPATAPGIPQTAELAASCAMIVPPAATIRAAPSAPSRPIPERTTPIAWAPNSFAQLSNIGSTEGRQPLGTGSSRRRITAPPALSGATVMCASPGATRISPRATGMPSLATEAGRPDAARSWRTNGSMKEPGRCCVTRIGNCICGDSAPSSWPSA